MSGRRLEFDKVYSHRRDRINYAFEKDENGIWIGKYEGIATGSGLAFCKTACQWSGLDISNSTDPVSRSRSMIQSLVDAGLITRKTDPETGESILNLGSLRI